MANMDDITNKAKAFLNDNKVKDALNSEQAENISDKLLDGVAGFAKKVTGGKYDEQIDKARDQADDSFGNDEETAATATAADSTPAAAPTDGAPAGAEDPTPPDTAFPADPITPNDDTSTRTTPGSAAPTGSPLL